MNHLQLEGKVERQRSEEDLGLINEGLRARVRSLEEELRVERAKNTSAYKGLQQLQAILSPLYVALQRIFGEIETIGISENVVAHGLQKSAAWEAWKQKLGGLPAKAIDVLLLHGEMNRTQLRIQVGCATRSVTDIVYKLNQAGLINKNGGKISLKEL